MYNFPFSVFVYFIFKLFTFYCSAKINKSFILCKSFLYISLKKSFLFLFYFLIVGVKYLCKLIIRLTFS